MKSTSAENFYRVPDLDVIVFGKQQQDIIELLSKQKDSDMFETAMGDINSLLEIAESMIGLKDVEVLDKANEFIKMINEYNQIIENFEYDSDILSKLSDLEAKKENIFNYAASHNFLDDGTLSNSSVEFLALINESTKTIDSDVKTAEETYANKIEQIIKRYDLKMIINTDTNVKFSTDIYEPQTNSLIKK